MRSGVALVLLLIAGAPAAAQRPSAWLQGDIAYHGVTNGFGDWRRAGLRAVVPQGAATWYAEVSGGEAFRDRGVWLGAAHRQGFGRDWFTFIGVGAGTGAYYLPDLRLDAQVGRAWLPSRTLVTSVGVMYADSKSSYRDLAFTGSVASYFAGGAVEVGGRLNRSTPGDVTTGRGHLALTLGRDRVRYVTLRAATGDEGYQLTGTTSTEQRFRSSEASASWREWLGGGLGGIVQLEWYDNPFYTRTGVTLGLFHHW